MAPIEKVATRVRMGDPDPDAGFWLTRPPAERVGHLRELQALYYGPDTADGGDNMLLGRDLQEFVALCLDHDVRFLVVGGHAVAAHGHPRLTKDLDIWIWVDPENADRMAAVLDEFGFASTGLTGKTREHPQRCPPGADRTPRRQCPLATGSPRSGWVPPPMPISDRFPPFRDNLPGLTTRQRYSHLPVSTSGRRRVA